MIEISAEEVNEVNISSTKIRRALQSGDMEKAKLFLGEPFEFHGKVVQGQTLGRDLGYPTANIDVESSMKLIPSTGVYAVNVLLENGTIFEGMMNIGVRPTVTDDNDKSIEVNLFDFNGDLYGKRITVQLLSRFRDEMKFDSIIDLKEQLNKDESSIRNYFSTLV